MNTTPSCQDLVVVGDWLKDLPPSLPVPDPLLSKILTYWFVSWKPKGIPLEIYLKHWTNRLENPIHTQTQEEDF